MWRSLLGKFQPIGRHQHRKNLNRCGVWLLWGLLRRTPRLTLPDNCELSQKTERSDWRRFRRSKSRWLKVRSRRICVIRARKGNWLKFAPKPTFGNGDSGENHQRSLAWASISCANIRAELEAGIGLAELELR